MFLRRFGKFKLLLLLGDILSFIIGGGLSLILFPVINSSLIFSISFYEKVIIFTLAGCLTIISFRYNNLYKHKIVFDNQRQFILIFKNLFWTFIIILILYFIFKPQKSIYGERLLIIIFLVASYICVLIFRFNFKSFYSTHFGNNFLKRRIIAIGAGDLGTLFRKEVSNEKFRMFEFIGFLDDKYIVEDQNNLKNMILGSTNDVVQITKLHRIDEIFITINNISQGDLLKLIKKSRITGCNINVLSDHFGIIEKKIDQSEFKNLEYVTIHSPLISSYFFILKRTIDLLFTSILILILSPILTVCALLIKVTSPGPIFYSPFSIGKNGQPFKFYKFRSMYYNAPHDSHMRLVEEFMNGKIVGAKLRSDPRVTKIGKFLRKYSLDELPQLFNVIRGDMSLVGPRPSTKYEFEMMDEWHKKRFDVLPGMTGLWQVAGRSEVSYIDMIMMDIYYVENGSFWLDLYILFKTIFVVITAKGGH